MTLCWPNHIDEAALSGGGWEAALPLDQLLNPVMADQARTLDADPANTQFTATLSRSRPIGVVALAKHNISTTAEWRVRVYFDAAGNDLAWDSGWGQVWPSIYATSELEWEYDNFWTGTIDDDERTDFTALATMFLDSPQIARRIDVEISDAGNPDGYVTLGRCLISDAWQPEYNMAYGVTYGYDIGTEFETAGDPGMTEYADPKTPKRTVTFALKHLSQEEGFRRALALQRTQGLHGEVLYTESAEANQSSFAKTFIGRQVSVDPLEHPYYANYANSISLKEIL
ncbi:hypothetical protein QC589_01425 [Halomonas elongata]|uniref:hypothetical protein n=1 Tax=Halomonas elongata TaxID=2746 RepID=UPI003353A516